MNERDVMGERIDAALGRITDRKNLARALATTNLKREKIVSATPQWQEMRTAAREIKEEVMGRWDHYLREFSGTAGKNGMSVHWAVDAAEARSIIGSITGAAGVRLVVKSKSMLTEEIELNAHLEGRGIEVVETDLGEFVAQISGEKPSHIIAPIIHKSKEQVIDLYRRKLDAPELESAEEITAFTRSLMREKFLDADAGITGANFGLAREGAVVIVENEGNVRLCSSLPRVHIIVMGIERLLPSIRELPLFLRLLAGSATGQTITNYVSIIRSPRRGGEVDGPEEVHLVLVDNGRSEVYRDPALREVLHCVRCGACLNICPVYERIGGHTYGWTYPGPVGSVLTPLLAGAGSPSHGELPYLSTLCGRCHEVCPVDISLEQLLVRLRRDMVSAGRRGPAERVLFSLFSKVAGNRYVYRLLERLLRPPLFLSARLTGRNRIPVVDHPMPAPRSFNRLWRERFGGKP